MFQVSSFIAWPRTPVLRKSLHDWRSRLPQLTVVLCCAAVTIYFAHHALSGRYGLEARNQLMERSNLLDFEISSLEAVRSKLARDVALLSPELPDQDLVEDVARDVLGFARPDDRILLQSNKN
jgi:cell division protein FtsB